MSLLGIGQGFPLVFAPGIIHQPTYFQPCAHNSEFAIGGVRRFSSLYYYYYYYPHSFLSFLPLLPFLIRQPLLNYAVLLCISNLHSVSPYLFFVRFRLNSVPSQIATPARNSRDNSTQRCLPHVRSYHAKKGGLLR